MAKVVKDHRSSEVEYATPLFESTPLETSRQDSVVRSSSHRNLYSTSELTTECDQMKFPLSVLIRQKLRHMYQPFEIWMNVICGGFDRDHYSTRLL